MPGEWHSPGPPMVQAEGALWSAGKADEKLWGTKRGRCWAVVIRHYLVLFPFKRKQTSFFTPLLRINQFCVKVIGDSTNLREANQTLAKDLRRRPGRELWATMSQMLANAWNAHFKITSPNSLPGSAFLEFWIQTRNFRVAERQTFGKSCFGHSQTP